MLGAVHTTSLPPLADPLGEALHLLRLDGAFYCRSELTAPWGLTMPPMDGCLWFHVVAEGACTIQIDGDPTARADLRTGDFALVPHGRGHVLRTHVDAATPSVLDLPQELLSERYSLLQHGRGGSRTILVCGVLRLAAHPSRSLAELLPPLVHLDAAATIEAEWMASTLRLMAAEARRLRPGGETIISRLSDVLVVHALRVWLDDPAHAGTGWLGALRDPQIGQALALMHRRPAEPWTVASLASAVAMSRSAFAARFRELVGTSPLLHLTVLRMHLAADEIREDGATVASVAARFGYSSDAAFSRAFKRVIGVPPGQVRRDGAPDVAWEPDASPTAP